MAFADINILAVLVATAVGFGAGFIWYRAFGPIWMATLGKTAEDMQPRPAPFVTAIVAQLVMAYILAGIMPEFGPLSLQSGIVIGAFLWLGFVATTIIVNDVFAGAKVTQTLIDAGHWLVVLVLMGATIGVFG